jgi:hypothetical protein
MPVRVRSRVSSSRRAHGLELRLTADEARPLAGQEAESPGAGGAAADAASSARDAALSSTALARPAFLRAQLAVSAWAKRAALS